LSSATIAVRVSAHAHADDAPGAAVIELTLSDPRGQVNASSSHPLPDSGVVEHTVQLTKPELWWPRVYGGQPLYSRKTPLRRGAAVPAQSTLRLGVRRLQLLQEPLPDGGHSFCFEINNQAVFCGGGNWIPADLLPTRVTPAHYRALLEEAVAAEMT